MENENPGLTQTWGDTQMNGSFQEPPIAIKILGLWLPKNQNVKYYILY